MRAKTEILLSLNESGAPRSLDHVLGNERPQFFVRRLIATIAYVVGDGNELIVGNLIRAPGQMLTNHYFWGQVSSAR